MPSLGRTYTTKPYQISSWIYYSMRSFISEISHKNLKLIHKTAFVFNATSFFSLGWFACLFILFCFQLKESDWFFLLIFSVRESIWGVDQLWLQNSSFLNFNLKFLWMIAKNMGLFHPHTRTHAQYVDIAKIL